MMQTLPEQEKSLWIEAFNLAYDGDEAAAVQRGWAAVAKSSPVHSEFYITKASTDPVSGEMRWMATASDTQDDRLGDDMTKRLFESFLRRIKAGEEVPELWQTDFWKGGDPYLSVSHYSGNRETVAGMSEVSYLDGDRFKSKGTFAPTAIGRAAYNSVRDSIKKVKAGIEDFDPVRISIGFLDYAHKHKGSGKEFVRKSLTDVCVECLREKLGIVPRGGISYLDGHLLHYGLTRVPINERSSIEVNKSMATMKDDAASIVGEDLAEELEEIEKELIKEAKQSRAMVTKSDTEEAPKVEEVVEEPVATIPDVVLTVAAPHTLDGVLAEFKSAFDRVDASDPETLKTIQGVLNKLGEAANAKVGKGTPAPAAQPDIEKLVSDAVDGAVKRAMVDVEAKLSMAIDRLSAVQPQAPVAPSVPVQRSIVSPAVVLVNDPAQHNKQAAAAPKLSSISQMINRSTGLPDNFVRPGATTG